MCAYVITGLTCSFFSSCIFNPCPSLSGRVTNDYGITIPVSVTCLVVCTLFSTTMSLLLFPSKCFIILYFVYMMLGRGRTLKYNLILVWERISYPLPIKWRPEFHVNQPRISNYFLLVVGVISIDRCVLKHI